MKIYWERGTLLAKSEGPDGITFLSKKTDGTYMVVRVMRRSIGGRLEAIVFEYKSAEDLWEDLRPREHKYGGEETVKLLRSASKLDEELKRVLPRKINKTKL